MSNQAITRAVRSNKLLLAVMSHLENSPSKLDKVLDIISQEPTLTNISTDIRRMYDDEMKKKKSDHNLTASTHKQCNVHTGTSPAISRYSVYLKKLYSRAKLPMRNKLSPFPCKKIIHLAVVEKCTHVNTLPCDRDKLKFKHSVDQFLHDTNATPIEFRDVLKMEDGSQPKCVIVQGVPGIGKSTFAWKACRKWGKGTLFQEHDLVILLRMRDTYVREAKNLTDLFYSPDKNLPQEVAKEVIEKDGKGVLFILEGIDELPSSILDDDNSILIELLQGILLPDVTILATTRPWALRGILEKCRGQDYRHIEILGFTKKDISQYVSHSFSEEEQEEFQRYLTTQPNVCSIMYVPLNTAIVVQIYLERKRRKQPLPVTMTELYKALVQSVIVRNIKCIPQYKDTKVDQDLENLPAPILEHFHQLCALAYSGFMKPSIQAVFSESDLPKDFDALGLLTGDVLVDIGYSVDFSFSHITIQEFLAAYHLSLQDQDMITDFVIKNCDSPLYKNLLLFLSGLTRFFEFERIQNYFFPINTWSSENNLTSTSIVCIEYLHWIYEGQCAEKCQNIFSATVAFLNHLSPRDNSLSSPFDIQAVHYCIKHSSCKWKVVLRPMSSALQALPPYQKIECDQSPNSVAQCSTKPLANIQNFIVIGWDVNNAPILFSLFFRTILPQVEVKSIFLLDGHVFLSKFDRLHMSTLPSPINQADSVIYNLAMQICILSKDLHSVVFSSVMNMLHVYWKLYRKTVLALQISTYH